MLVLVFAAVFRVELWEFILVLLLAAAVLILELFNSVIERIADGLSPRLRPMVRDIKDVMAAAVLITAVVAAIVGVIIFLPYILEIM